MQNIDLNRHYVSITLLSLLLVRVIIVGASLGEAFSILALAGFAGYSLFISNRNRDLEAELKLQLESQEKSIQMLEQKTEILGKLTAELQDLRQQVSIIKIDKAFGQVQSTVGTNFKTTQQQRSQSDVGIKKKIF
jgi:hypothetical protein